MNTASLSQLFVAALAWRQEGIEPYMKSDLIVALDVSRTADALAVVDRLPTEVVWYKIGLELFCAEGPAIIQSIQIAQKKRLPRS